MPPKNDPANQPESQPPDLFSNVEARAMIEEFREAIRAGVLRVTPENEVQPVRQRAGDAAKQTEPSPSKDEELAQLMEWFERRREQKANETRRKDPPKPIAVPQEQLSASMRQKVVDRVAHKIVEAWDHADQESDPGHTLRDQIVEKIAEDVLRRLQRNLE